VGLTVKFYIVIFPIICSYSDFRDPALNSNTVDLTIPTDRKQHGRHVGIIDREPWNAKVGCAHMAWQYVLNVNRCFFNLPNVTTHMNTHMHTASYHRDIRYRRILCFEQVSDV